MKIVLLSNYLNHHQKPFCDEMFRLIGDDFFFIETVPIDEERLKMGWGEAIVPSYVLRTYENYKLCQEKINEADIVIKGHAPEKLLLERKKDRKVVLRYTERLLKRGTEIWKYIPRFIRLHYYSPVVCPIYMLCASAYTASDYRKFGLFKNKTYKWGYFTELKEYSNILDVIKHKKKNSILWVARFMKLKHPEYVIELAKYLKKKGYAFEIKMIGSGEQEGNIKKMIIENELSSYVFLLGSMSPEKVRKHMEQSEIFVFTSDQQEGWGAVMNESMNSACAVVADKRIGSVPFLVKSGENGFAYDSLNDFIYKVEKLLIDGDLKRYIGINAYNTIRCLWNPRVAAERCLKLFDSLIRSKECNLFLEGPCSRC